MNRIDTVFNKLKEENKKALIGFVANGDPTLDETVDIVLELEKNGVDIIELGAPFSDPLADGPVIQEAYIRALKNKTKTKDLFYVTKEIRKSSEIPVIIMIYYNLIYKYGIDKFLEDCKNSGVDGLIVPDIPIEERAELKAACEENGVYLIPLVAPTSKERIQKIADKAKGFVYCVSSNGTTGERASFSEDITSYLDIVKEKADVPICLGFGISSRETVRAVKNYCDGVIVGSAIVRRIYEDKSSVSGFVRELKDELNLK